MSRSPNANDPAAMSKEAEILMPSLSQRSKDRTTSPEPRSDGVVESSRIIVTDRILRKAGTITQVCRAILDSLAFLIESTTITSTVKRNGNILRRCNTSLKLWADGHHLWTGELEQVLERSTNLRRTTLYMLHTLCRKLLLGLKWHLGPDTLLLQATADACDATRLELRSSDKMTTDTDSSDDEGSEVDIGSDRMDRLTKAVKMYTDCLLDLSPALECPAPDTKRVDFVAALQQQAPLISTRPSGSPSPVLEAQASGDDEQAINPKRVRPAIMDGQIPEGPPDFLKDFSEIPDYIGFLDGDALVKLRPAISALETGIEAWSLEKAWPGICGHLQMFHTRYPSIINPVTIASVIAMLDGDKNSNRKFDCPVFVAESRHGWPRTCNNVKSPNMAEVRRHLIVRSRRGSRPQLTFLKTCATCNEDFLDKDVFETRHGYRGELCNTRRPMRRGEHAKVQWQLLYQQVEKKLAVQHLSAEQVEPDSKPSRSIPAPKDSAFDDGHEAIRGPTGQRLDGQQDYDMAYATPYQLIFDPDSDKTHQDVQVT